jgi:hypothetical protein
VEGVPADEPAVCGGDQRLPDGDGAFRMIEVLASLLLLAGASGAENAQDIAFYCEVGSGDIASAARIEGSPTNQVWVWHGKPTKAFETMTDEAGNLVILHDPADLFPASYSWDSDLPKSLFVFGPGEWSRSLRISRSIEEGSSGWRIDLMSSQKGEKERNRRIRDYLTGSCNMRVIGFSEFLKESGK